MKPLIDGDAEVISHRPPHRWIDPRHPGRKLSVTRAELVEMFARGARRYDLEALYRYDKETELYYLKEEFL